MSTPPFAISGKPWSASVVNPLSFVKVVQRRTLDDCTLVVPVLEKSASSSIGPISPWLKSTWNGLMKKKIYPELMETPGGNRSQRKTFSCWEPLKKRVPPTQSHHHHQHLLHPSIPIAKRGGEPILNLHVMAGNGTTKLDSFRNTVNEHLIEFFINCKDFKS